MLWKNIRNRKVEICYRDSAADNAIVAWDVGMSKEEVSKMLKKHPTWYRSSAEIIEGEIIK